MKSILTIMFVGGVMFYGMIAQARPIFAQREKKPCQYCHAESAGGGKRGFRGIYYGVHNHTFKGFSEKKEAKLAGVKPNSMGVATTPKKPYLLKKH